ncbi:MAG: hypothetical protein LBU32_02585 [Clostridiales bacterium]|jgi:hypothetical protein|nr:hypothetical protein [Clostridiales bacterium]
MQQSQCNHSLLLACPYEKDANAQGGSARKNFLHAKGFKLLLSKDVSAAAGSRHKAARIRNPPSRRKEQARSGIAASNLALFLCIQSFN